MKRGFTLTEMLTATSIVVTLAAVSYPVFVQARRAAQKSACVSNLRQMGLAIELYRAADSGSERGSPVQMGLPAPASATSLAGTPLWCHGTTPDGEMAGYHIMWPRIDADPKALQIWEQYVDMSGPSSVLVYDPNHQPSAGPRSETWENWTALGLKMDTSVVTRTRLGYPHTPGWWIGPQDSFTP